MSILVNGQGADPWALLTISPTLAFVVGGGLGLLTYTLWRLWRDQ